MQQEVGWNRFMDSLGEAKSDQFTDILMKPQKNQEDSKILKVHTEMTWGRFMDTIDVFKNDEIPEVYRKQFKTKDEFIYPKDKRFIPLARRVQTDEKLRTQRKWDKECKMFLLWVMIRYFQSKGKIQVDPAQQEWEELSQILNLDKHQLKARWITLINPKQKSQNWTSPEDEVIRESMKQRMHKHIWTLIAVKLYELNICPCARTPKQVRERWINYLNPNLRKDHWLMREDLTILNIVLKKGKKWSYIAKKLDGRTENQVKNRYKSLINKIWTDDEVEETEAIMQYVSRNQSAINTQRLGMKSNRGRRKGNKQSKSDNPSRQNKKSLQYHFDQDDQEQAYQESAGSDSFSPKKKVKRENKVAVYENMKNELDIPPLYMKLRSQSKNNFSQDGGDQQYKYTKQPQTQQYKDYQRDFSNYFYQLSEQQNLTEQKIHLLNQAIDQLEEKYQLVSPKFQSYNGQNQNFIQDNSSLLRPIGATTPDMPFANFNCISPLQYKFLNEQYSQALKFPQQYDQNQNPLSNGILNQSKIQKIFGSQPASALGVNSKQGMFDMNSAILKDFVYLDFKMDHEKVGGIDDFINPGQALSDIFLTPGVPPKEQSLDQNQIDQNQKNQNSYIQFEDPIAIYNKRRNLTQNQ